MFRSRSSIFFLVGGGVCDGRNLFFFAFPVDVCAVMFNDEVEKRKKGSRECEERSRDEANTSMRQITFN